MNPGALRLEQMGNSGSSQKRGGGSASSASAATSIVVCYYELLGIELTATPEEIKKAYRSKALQLHPDKNMHRVQEATEMFSKIQNAYQVLSDPQERAFYDRHRESILRKGKSNNKVAESGYSVEDLMNFFDPSVFKGYSDDSKGFFAVYRDLFAFLEDLEAEEFDNPSRYDFASFGSKNTPFEPSLKNFYDKFLHFSSIRAFYEADNYDEEYAENRRHRRAIGKENQKYRDAMRREYNDTVRNLASWVRKRDPRWQSYQKERTIQRQQAEARRKEETIRRRNEMAENYVAPDWTHNDDFLNDEEFLLQQLERLQFESFTSETHETEPEIHQDNNEDEELEDFDDFYCVVCKKVFKNHKQWKNHEQSKKHRSNMLKAGFKPEDSEEISDYDDFYDFEDEGEIMENEIFSSESEACVYESDLERSECDIQESFEIKIIKSDDEGIGKQKPPKKKARQKKSNISTESTKSKQSATKPKLQKFKSTTSTNSDSKCNICGELFDSRNKLFKHIEITGHVAFKSSNKKK